LNKLGIWAIVIVAAFVVGILSANPVVEAAGGWKEAVADLLAQITSNDAEIADHETRIVDQENKPTPKIQKQIEKHTVDMTTACPEFTTGGNAGEPFVCLERYVHHTFSCTNDGIIDGVAKLGVAGSGVKVVQQNGEIQGNTVDVSDDFTTIDFDSRWTVGPVSILTVELRCASIVP